MKKNIICICLVVCAIMSSCESEVQVNKNLDLAKFNGFWDLEILGEKLYLSRSVDNEEVKYDLTFECRSNYKSYLVLNDSIFIFINANPICHEIKDCIRARRIDKNRNSVYINDGEIKGLDFGVECEGDVAMVTHRNKYRKFRKNFNLFKQSVRVE